MQRTIWNPASYLARKAYIDYFSPNEPVFHQLASLPPLVSFSKIKDLRKKLVLCEEGKSQLWHMGDCAEPFEDAETSILKKKLSFFRKTYDKLLLNKSDITMVGRIGGQYAKPRSVEFTVDAGKQIHNYKGDNVNTTDPSNRNPQAHRLKEGYDRASMTLNTIQSHMPELYSSHEGLVLPFEASMVRQFAGQSYCCSAAMLWIGERTRQLDGAHVQFFRGIQNSLGVKVSSKITTKEFIELVQTLNPTNAKGKLLVIIRMGEQNLKFKLPTLIEAKQRYGLNFLFVTDPMHGCTYQIPGNGLKTRKYTAILAEATLLKKTVLDSGLPFGVSLESTYLEDATECHGGAYPLQESELVAQRFYSKCDPRLNPAQTFRLVDDLMT